MALHLVLDTETTTLPGVAAWAPKDSAANRNVATSMPLVFNIGWLTIDDYGRISNRSDYLIEETFNRAAREEAYFDRWDYYQEAYENGEIEFISWAEAMNRLETIRKKCVDIVAYNAKFDFYRAIPYTTTWVENKTVESWVEQQMQLAHQIAEVAPTEEEIYELTNYEATHPWEWNFNGYITEVVDVWNMACKTILNTDAYKIWNIKQGNLTPSAMYFKTNAENCYQFLTKKAEFVEGHTALADCEIEAEIYYKLMKRYGIKACNRRMPSRQLGKIIDFIKANTAKFNPGDYERLINNVTAWRLTKIEGTPSYSMATNMINTLINIKENI